MNDTILAREFDQSAERSVKRRHKILAFAAGGLVLGVGAVTTLAAWTSTEHVHADFAAGHFGLQASADGVSYSTNSEAPGLEVSFGDLAGTLAPGDVVYAPYAIRLAPESSYAADVVLAASEGTGAAAGDLRYDVFKSDTFGCDASTQQALLTDQPATVSTASSSLFTLDAIDQPVYLCFKVTAGEDLQQGAAGDISWRLLGTSTDPLG